MKKTKLFLLAIVVAVASISCTEQRTSSHEVMWSPDQKDSVVYVRYVDENGSFSNFYMNYMLYSMLFRQGGYTSVNNYYASHPGEFSNSNKFTTYSSRSNSTTSSYSSPSRTSSSSSSSSYRSSSSPSRSYSSPSRGYSSPSRSYSSPSRGR